MIIVIVFLVLIIGLILWKNKKKILLKIKKFFKTCKLLIVIELLIIIFLLIFNIYNKTVTIKEKDPHSNEILKSVNLKEGQIYIFKTIYFEKNNKSDGALNIIQKYKEKDNIIKIEKVGINKIKVLINETEEEYKYGTGFSYHGQGSCSCGTPIIFEKSLIDIMKVMILFIVIINLLFTIFIKIEDKNKQNIE